MKQPLRAPVIAQYPVVLRAIQIQNNAVLSLPQEVIAYVNFLLEGYVNCDCFKEIPALHDIQHLAGAGPCYMGFHVLNTVNCFCYSSRPFHSLTNKLFS